jgi:hypothetical protein
MSYIIGSIYRIVCLCEPDIQYVGSTFDTLRNRWQRHKYGYMEYLKGKHREIAIYPYFTKYGIDKFKILLIKEYKVCAENNIDKTHLSVYEQLWMNKINCVNKNNCCRIASLLNIEKYSKEYREKNKEKKAEYREKNKKKFAEKKKEFYEKNKEKIAKKMAEKITCDCGSIVSKIHLSRHKKTKKHINLMLKL